MTEQYMQIFVQEQIRALTMFFGTRYDDVNQWLQDTEEKFDRVQLKPSNKYLAVQSYLTGTADTWFRLHKLNIPDWSTFKKEILEVFKTSVNQTLFTVEQQQPVVHPHNYASSAPGLNLSSVMNQSSSDSNTHSLPPPEIKPLPLPISNSNVYQQPDIVVLPEQSSSHESINTESIKNSTVDNTVDNIPSINSSTITNIPSPCSVTAVVNNNIAHEGELQQLQSDEIKSCSLNKVPLVNSEFISLIGSMKLNVQVNNRDKNLAAYDIRGPIYRMIAAQDFIPTYHVNISLSTNRIHIHTHHMLLLKLSMSPLIHYICIEFLLM
ncbi:unnamed protein product [Rotaria magnacalcarata]|uniref:Retrotransposon gag domain-containing protein n=3 Tax=Rotaria magnacalcarata TaxID=392030 RepID=A0A816P913_9BILA|nr:unnamed protein product [Rotaria magnacalcarata]